MPKIDAVALPDSLTTDQLSGKVAVVIDVLRATTTIVEAISNGARSVIPVASVDGARMLAADRGDAILCGERGGVKQDGFVLGNSPLEYQRAAIQDRDLILSTTNGTRAIHMASEADVVLIGSVTNYKALCELIRNDGRDVILICSGTDRKVSLEDCIGAGLIVQELGYSASDSAAMMFHATTHAVEQFNGIRFAIESSFHAQRLIKLGYADDVAFAGHPSGTQVVPCFESLSGEITGHPFWARMPSSDESLDRLTEE